MHAAAVSDEMLAALNPQYLQKNAGFGGRGTADDPAA
jgi:hypothetical protein